MLKTIHAPCLRSGWPHRSGAEQIDLALLNRLHAGRRRHFHPFDGERGQLQLVTFILVSDFLAQRYRVTGRLTGGVAIRHRLGIGAIAEHDFAGAAHAFKGSTGRLRLCRLQWQQHGERNGADEGQAGTLILRLKVHVFSPHAFCVAGCFAIKVGAMKVQISQPKPITNMPPITASLPEAHSA